MTADVFLKSLIALRAEKWRRLERPEQFALHSIMGFEVVPHFDKPANYCELRTR